MVAPVVFGVVGSFGVVLVLIIVITIFLVSKRTRQASTPKKLEAQELGAPTSDWFLQEGTNHKPMVFTAQQLRTFTSNYSTKLGSGGFGVVYKGHFPNGTTIAVKVLNRSSDKNARDQFMDEVSTISKTNHPNLVKFYGLCYDPSLVAVVLEYMENGSLDKYLFKERDRDPEQEGTEWEILHGVAVGTARGIAYLHEECYPRIIHYDIKPGNVLLDGSLTTKVADFGLAKLCNKDNTHESVTGYRGTPGYSAPEFFYWNHPITQKCDVYSFGMVLFEIVGRRRNVACGSSSSGSLDWFPKRVWDEYEKGEEFTVACGISDKDREKAERMCKVALWCVQDSPDFRPPMSVVVKMLEGEVEILPPPQPFKYVYSKSLDTLQSYESSNDSSQRMMDEISSYWYEDTTPDATK